MVFVGFFQRFWLGFRGFQAVFWGWGNHLEVILIA